MRGLSEAQSDEQALEPLTRSPSHRSRRRRWGWDISSAANDKVSWAQPQSSPIGQSHEGGVVVVRGPACSSCMAEQIIKVLTARQTAGQHLVEARRLGVCPWSG